MHQRNLQQNQLLKLANSAADEYYAQMGQPKPVGTLANAGGKLGLGLGIGAGAIRSVRKGKNLKQGLITSAGTGALWGLGGAIGGSLFKDDL